MNATYLANWHKSTAHQRSRALQNNLNENAKRIQHHDYQPNDMEYLTNRDVKRKLDIKQGPFRIVSIHTNGTVTIQRSPAVILTYVLYTRLLPYISNPIESKVGAYL